VQCPPGQAPSQPASLETAEPAPLHRAAAHSLAGGGGRAGLGD